MTNQTNLDYLFKITAPLPERSAGGSTSASGRRPAFDDHLLNASASASSSSSSAAAGTRSADSAPAESTGPASQDHSDDDRAATNDEALESSVASDAITSPANELHDDAEPSINDDNEESAGDVATSEDEIDSDHDATQELAAAALIAGHSAAHEEVATEEPVGETAKSDAENVESLKSASSSNFDGGEDRSTGDLSGAELAAEDATANLEADQSTAPTSAGKQTKRSHSTEVVAADSKSPSHSTAEKRFDANRASAEATANIENAAPSAKLKAEKSATAGRRSSRTSEKSADDSGRGATSSATQSADSTDKPDRVSLLAVANGVSARAANSITQAGSGEDGRQGVKPAGHASEGIHMTARAQRAGSTSKGRAHAASPDLPRVDAARFVGRVAKAVQTAQERGGLVQLRLSPPELGSLRLELSMQNGVMTAAVETETPAARQILLDHLPALRDRLAEQNIRIERFDVDVRQENSGGQADPRASQQEQREHQPQQPHSRHAAGRSAATQAATGDAPQIGARLSSSELNLLA